jgi:hypothetical protein
MIYFAGWKQHWSLYPAGSIQRHLRAARDLGPGESRGRPRRRATGESSALKSSEAKLPFAFSAMAIVGAGSRRRSDLHAGRRRLQRCQLLGRQLHVTTETGPSSANAPASCGLDVDGNRRNRVAEVDRKVPR